MDTYCDSTKLFIYEDMSDTPEQAVFYAFKKPPAYRCDHQLAKMKRKQNGTRFYAIY